MAIQYPGAMGLLSAALSGGVPQLPFVNVAGGRVRGFVCPIVLAAQPIGEQIAVARVPAYSQLISCDIMTDTSLSTSTLSLGNVNGATVYGPATLDTTTGEWVNLLNTAALLSPIPPGDGVHCFDSVSGLPVLDHEDLVLTVAALALPAAGNLFFRGLYQLD